MGLMFWPIGHELGTYTTLKSFSDSSHMKRTVRENNWFIERKEGNVLFNDALNTFYLQLYGVRHMVKDHSDSERKPATAI